MKKHESFAHFFNEYNYCFIMRFGGGGLGEKYSAVHQSSEDVLLFLSLDQSDAKKTITKSFRREMSFQRFQ